jgi:hypothetical protein
MAVHVNKQGAGLEQRRERTRDHPFNWEEALLRVPPKLEP